MTQMSMAPPAPRLRAIRNGWLAATLRHFENQAPVRAVALVGSLGRGDADDWSDVDLLIVVPDDRVERYVDATGLPGARQVAMSFDARQNVPAGAGSIGVRYVIDGLPLCVDWYVYPLWLGASFTDAKVIFDRLGLPRLAETFAEHLAMREVQASTVKAPGSHRLLQLSLIPVAAKHIVRRSAGAARMVEFVGGPYAPDATAEEQLETLRQLLRTFRGEAAKATVTASRRYLDLVEEAL